MIVRVTLVIIACLLLAAHFLRVGNYGLTLVWLLIPGLLLIRKAWSLLVLQALLYGGAVIWLFTTITTIQTRLRLDAPWDRLALILGTVTLLTLLSGLLLNSPVMRERYRQ
jgi:hypothetical protein